MSQVKERKEIYLGESLRRVLERHKARTLTTVVNLIADRYLGMVERTHPVASVRMDDVYRKVLAEYRRPLESADIASFPARVRDWMLRNPMEPGEAHYAATIAHVEKATFVDLVALIDRLEST